MPKFTKNPTNNSIPVKLTEDQFNKFISEHLSLGSLGPDCSIPLYKVFNYIMTVTYTGMQWQQLPIELR